MSVWLQQYSLFVKAKNIGIKFGTHDLTVEQLNTFTIIKDQIEELDKKKNNG